VKLEESPLILTEIDSSLEYNSEKKTSTGFAFHLYTLLLPILSPTSYHLNMSQYDLYQIIRQQQKQLAAI